MGYVIIPFLIIIGGIVISNKQHKCYVTRKRIKQQQAARDNRLATKGLQIDSRGYVTGLIN